MGKGSTVRAPRRRPTKTKRPKRPKDKCARKEVSGKAGVESHLAGGAACSPGGSPDRAPRPTVLATCSSSASFSSRARSSLSRLYFLSTTTLTHAAELMLDRTDLAHNWEASLRSFVELAAWLPGNPSPRRVSNVVVSASRRAVRKKLVVLCDAFNSALRFVERSVLKSSPHLSLTEASLIVVVFSYGLFLRFPSGDRFFKRLLLARSSSLAQALKMTRPTHRIGCNVHDRLVNAPQNWSRHTIRSALETSASRLYGDPTQLDTVAKRAHMAWAVPTAIDTAPWPRRLCRRRSRA